jgi:type IV secretory pathway VirB4 component
MPGNSQDLVGIEEVKSSTMIMKDGSLRQVLLVGGLNFQLKSEEEQNSISAAYQNFLNSIDFRIQTIVHSRKVNIDRYIKNLDEKIKEEPSPLLQNQIAEYREFIKQFVQDHDIMSKSFFVVVPFYPTSVTAAAGGVVGNIPFLSRKPSEEQKKQDATAKEEEFKKNLEQLGQRVDQVIQGLSAAGLEVLVANDEQIIELLYNFYNPESTEKEDLILPGEKQTEQ